MNLTPFLAIVTVCVALAMPAYATSRPKVSKEVSWKEARQVLAEFKAAPSLKSLPETDPCPVPKILSTLAARPHGASRERFHPARTTAYFHGEADHLAYGCKSALGSDIVYGSTNRSAAADWSSYPLGTCFRIVGDSYDCEYRVDTYGKALVGTNTIDLYKPTRGAMNAWGCREVVIGIITWGSFEESLRIMADRTRSPHVRRMVEAIRVGGDRNGSGAEVATVIQNPPPGP